MPPSSHPASLREYLTDRCHPFARLDVHSEGFLPQIDWTAVVTQVGSVTTITGALAILANFLVKWWFAKSIETHKADLKRVNDAAVEEVKHELKLIELRQTKIVEKQAHVIAGVFSRLETAHEQMTVLAAPNLHKVLGARAVLDAAELKYNEFAAYSGCEAIWLPLALSSRVLALAREMQMVLTRFASLLDDSGDILDRHSWMEAYTSLHVNVETLRGELEVEFRKLLGVIDAE